MKTKLRIIGNTEGLRTVNGVQIEDDIPLPERSDRLRAGQLVEILAGLRVGQSFLHHSHGRAAARTLKPRKFTSHPDKIIGRWRIWRVS